MLREETKEFTRFSSVRTIGNDGSGDRERETNARENSREREGRGKKKEIK